ncbi:hypothetical protein M0R45_010229 [Rubus argutus]|uniref:Uncharacterized protein n=1 Tax=Rubus argutus TaxID=59490 RepID=A0AAW1Y8Y6_RUBAR
MKVNGLQRACQFSHKKRRKTMNSFRWCQRTKFCFKEQSQAVVGLEHESWRECESQKGSSFEKRQVVIDSEQEYQGPGPSIDNGEAEIDDKEFESEDLRTTIGAEMPCWKVSDEKSRLNGGVVSRRYTSHSKTL